MGSPSLFFQSVQPFTLLPKTKYAAVDGDVNIKSF